MHRFWRFRSYLGAYHLLTLGWEPGPTLRKTWDEPLPAE
jgi:hypothetical protein